MSDYDQTYRTSAAYFGTDPDPLLMRGLTKLPPGARILDIGVGQGRNALFAAAAGLRVTGLDTSAEALAQTKARAEAAGVSLELWRGDFQDYDPEATFDAVLCFGLMQVLSRAECASLVHRLHDWTGTGAMLMLRAWHVDDPSYDYVRAEWAQAGLHSFRSASGDYRTYLARGVISNLLRGWEFLHLEEKIGPVHRHGDEPEHRHGDVELIARRR